MSCSTTSTNALQEISNIAIRADEVSLFLLFIHLEMLGFIYLCILTAQLFTIVDMASLRTYLS